MNEKLYAIPVNDAFNADCECPICQMFAKLETDAVEYTMGPSYMEDDTRALTDAEGFCQKHIKMVYAQNNRLGMAWVMKTHFDKLIRDIGKDMPAGNGKTLRKGIEDQKTVQYLDKLNSSCFVCNRINNTFDRYIDTVFFLWRDTEDFRKKYANTKGFCSLHYNTLIKRSVKHLKGTALEDFISVTNGLYMNNMIRLRDELEWFINKFDYRYADEPWKNSKDSVLRSMTKEAAFIPEE